MTPVFCFVLGLFFVVVCGAPIMYGADETTSSTTTTPWQQKLKYTFTAIAGNNYLVKWTTEIHADTAADAIHVRLQLDDTTTYNEQEWHPNPDIASGWAVASGFVKIDNPGAGSHDVDIDYSTSTAGQTVSIRRARIWIQEVNV